MAKNAKSTSKVTLEIASLINAKFVFFPRGLTRFDSSDALIRMAKAVRMHAPSSNVNPMDVITINQITNHHSEIQQEFILEHWVEYCYLAPIDVEYLDSNNATIVYRRLLSCIWYLNNIYGCSYNMPKTLSKQDKLIISALEAYYGAPVR